jgi:leucyl-tRNA synthetase
MCSSFYFLRYPEANNPDQFLGKELADKMFPIPLYTGGKEHTVGHLLYARFIHKFLYDQGYVTSPEPVTKLVHQGMVLGADGRKMGKRFNNGVDPMEVVEKYGADAVRTYMMFMGPVEQDKAWNDGALQGVKKFLDRVRRIPTQERYDTNSDKVESALHQAIKGITYDMEHLKLNTGVSKLMIMINSIYEHKACTAEQLRMITLLFAPYATQLAEDLWTLLGETDDVHFHARPVADESKIQASELKIPVQINGKVRATVIADPGMDEATILSLAQESENISRYTE